MEPEFLDQSGNWAQRVFTYGIEGDRPPACLTDHAKPGNWHQIMVGELEQRRDSFAAVKYPQHFKRIKRNHSSSWATAEDIDATKTTEDDQRMGERDRQRRRSREQADG